MNRFPLLSVALPEPEVEPAGATMVAPERVFSKRSANPRSWGSRLSGSISRVLIDGPVPAVNCKRAVLEVVQKHPGRDRKADEEPQTAKTAEEHGLRVDVLAEKPAIDVLAQGLADFGSMQRAAALEQGESVWRPSLRRAASRRKAK